MCINIRMHECPFVCVCKNVNVCCANQIFPYTCENHGMNVMADAYVSFVIPNTYTHMHGPTQEHTTNSSRVHITKIQTSLQIGKSRKLTLLFQSYADLDPLLIPTSPNHSISVTHFYRKHTWCIYSIPEFMRFLLLLPFRGWFFNEILFILLWLIFLSNSWSRQIEIYLHETDVSPNQTNILSHHNVNLITTKYILLCFVFHTFNYFTFHPEIINGNCFISSDIIFLLFYSFRITKRLITQILNFPLNS